MAETVTLLRRLERHMLDRGLKSTRQRQVILDTFLEVDGHVAVDELLVRVQAHMPSVGYATVYRTLKLFVEAGVAHERRFGDGQARYEPVRTDEHHDHLICMDCGHIFEFEDPIIEERQAQVALEHGIRLVSHRHDIYGSCSTGPACPFRGDPGLGAASVRGRGSAPSEGSA